MADDCAIYQDNNVICYANNIWTWRVSSEKEGDIIIKDLLAPTRKKLS